MVGWLGFKGVNGFVLVPHSIIFTALLVLGLTYFFILVINSLILLVVTHTVFAICHIKRGLAVASQAIKAGFVNCQKTIHHQVITQANHFANIGFNEAQATCACIFLQVYCSISFTTSCLAVKLSLKIEFNLVNAVWVCISFHKERVFVISLKSFVTFS